MGLALFILFLVLNLIQTESATYINGACVDCQNGILVPGGGSSAAAPVLRQLSFSFRLVDPTIQVDYTSQALDVAMNHLQSSCRKTYQYDFAALDYSLAAWMVDSHLLSTDLDSIPVVAYANVITYNLPGVIPDVDPDLILSRQNLYDIMYGDLTVWNDPRLKFTNPLLAERLPNQTITLVLRSDPNGAAGGVMTMLNNIRVNVTANSYTKWPNYFLDLPNRSIVQGSNGVIAAITATPYTLGFVPQSYVDEAGLPDAKIENIDGYIVEAFEDLGVLHSIEAAQNTSDTLNPADQHGIDAYPLGQIVHLVYHTNIDTGCDSRVAMAKFIHWILTSPDALMQIFANPGFISLPTVLVDQVLKKIGNLKCDEVPLLQITYQDYGGDVLTETITIFSTVLIAITVGILSTLSYKRNNRITKAAGLAFAFFFLLGCIFNYISTIFWASIPLNTSICIGRYTFVSLGYALILGAMFAKCWEISKIFYRAEKGDISPFKELPWWMFCRAFFAVVFFEAVLLLIWLLVDPPVSKTRMLDEYNLLAIHECTTHHPSIWYGFHFIYFGVVLLWGAYLAYITRDIWQKYNYPNESRSILLSIYNLGFCCVILVPLVTALDASPQVMFFLISVAIIFPTTFALIMVHGPKMLAFLATSLSKGSKGKKDSLGHHPTRDRDGPTSLAESHTLRIIKGTDHEREKDRELERSLMDDASGRDVPMTPITKLKGTRSIEDPKVITEAPLGSSWKVLTPSVGSTHGSTHTDDTTTFDLPEVQNPLFGENV